VVRGLPGIIFLGLLVFTVIGIIVGVAMDDSSIKKMLASASSMLAVDFIRSCGSLAVEARARGSRLIMFTVVSVFSFVIVIGCIVSIVIVVCCIFWRLVWSCIKLTWILAFSASKLMHCGCGVLRFAVVLVFSGIVIVCCIVGIVIVVCCFF